MASNPWQNAIFRIPWVNSQIDLLKHNSGELLRQWTPWKNPFTAVGNFARLGLNVSNAFSLFNWASKAGVVLSSPGVLLGGALGIGLGIATASVLGLPIGAGIFIGGAVGGIIGGVIGSFFTPIGTYIGVTVGSWLGSTIGGFLDKIFGKINSFEAMFKALFGALNLFKGIMDLIDSMGKKFDPATVFGFTLTIVFGFGLIAEAAEQYKRADLAQVDTTTSAQAEVEGISTGPADSSSSSDSSSTGTTGPKTIDCLNTISLRVQNPTYSKVTSIKEDRGVYEISTSDYIFTNITDPADSIELNGSLLKGKIVGYCN
jgi:hypothetical protein